MPGANIATTAATAGLGLFQDLAVAYASRPGTLTEPTTLAAKLAEISNGIKEKSLKGLYVPGMTECTEEHFKSMRLAGIKDFNDFIINRTGSGSIFHYAYGIYLKRYDQGPLEKQVAQKQKE